MTKTKKATKRRKGQSCSKAMLAVLKPRMDCKAWPGCACILRGNYKRDCMDLRCP